MDPGTGRHFVRPARLLSELFVHHMAVPADCFREYAGSGAFLRPLGRRLRRLGVSGDGETLLGRAAADASGRAVATLDAAVRMTEALAVAGGIDRGRAAARLVEALVDAELARPPPPPEPPSTGLDGGITPRAPEEPIPAPFWTVRPAPPDEDGARVWLRGAVLVTVKGVRPAEGRRADLPPELAQALAEPPARPGWVLWSLLREDGLLVPAALGAGLGLAGGAALVEALLLRGVFDLGFHLGVVRQRVGAAVALLVFLGALLAIELPVAGGLLRLGRHLEARLRVAFLRKIPRLGDRYFQSRPTSDMVQRSHSVHALRALPVLGGQLVRSAIGLAVTVAGIVWLDPRGAPVALAAAALSVLVPLGLASVINERDLRVRSHAGSLSRFYLDALLGLTPLRAHGAARALRREHEGVLVAFLHASLDLLRAAVAMEAMQAVLGFACAGALVLGHLARAGDPSRTLLLLYWSLNLPVLGEQIALAARLYPAMRNVTLRLLEPLGAMEEASASAEASEGSAGAAAIRFEGVRVVAAGHTILDEVDLALAPGEHVAIVGPSGAGKSSLAGLLLGWHRPERGALLVDGAPLVGARLAALRRETVWVDPAVQLWNRTLHDNLRYGARPGGPSMMKVIEDAELRGVLELLPEGLQTPLGEGGALVSGGEGQRVRLGRAVQRGRARLVILDEAFRGLDRARRHDLLARARRLWQGTTLIAVTHDVGETRHFPRVLVIEGGRVVEDGPPDALLGEGTRYRALVDAEESVRRGLWGGRAFRRLTLARGRISEESW
jgi:ATP-binding cassette subfamily B protein